MFRLDPDVVYLKEFDSVIVMLAAARREQELDDRVGDIRRTRK